MAYTPVPVERFGGLDLYNDPQEVGMAGALDATNVELDFRGRVRSRDGWSLLGTTATSAVMTGMAYYSQNDGTEYIVVSDSGTLYPFDLSTGVVSTTVGQHVAGGNASFVRFGSPTESVVIAATGTDGFRTWDGSSWTNHSAPASISGQADYVAVTPNDNRLAVACNTILPASIGFGTGETVAFSDAGAPYTFGSNNYVSLWPGDGEPITGLMTWRDKLFAFKYTKFAVFTSTSTGADGNPIFNYYGVNAGRGCAAPGACVVGEEGVYFVDRTGVYVTTGGEPRYISRQLEPWLKAGSFTGLPDISLAGATLAYHDRRLYVTYPKTASVAGATLVYDPAVDSWFVWQLGATAAVGIPSSSSTRNLIIADYTTKKVSKALDTTVSTDNGTAITSSYRSGFYELGAKGADTFTRWTRLWGYGSPTVSVFTDMGSTDSSAASVTLGTSPTVAEGYHSVSYKGKLFSHKLSATSGAWSVSRMQHDVASVRH